MFTWLLSAAIYEHVCTNIVLSNDKVAEIEVDDHLIAADLKSKSDKLAVLPNRL